MKLCEKIVIFPAEKKAQTAKSLGKKKVFTPLAMLSEGDEGKVKEIRGGRGLIRRLSELGFIGGERIRIIHSQSSGPILVEIKDSRIAIGRGVAMKIIIDR